MVQQRSSSAQTTRKQFTRRGARWADRTSRDGVRQSCDAPARCESVTSSASFRNRGLLALLASARRVSDVPMDWAVILSGAVCVARLALGLDMILPLGSALETLCGLIAIASATVFFGLVEGS